MLVIISINSFGTVTCMQLFINTETMGADKDNDYSDKHKVSLNQFLSHFSVNDRAH